MKSVNSLLPLLFLVVVLGCNQGTKVNTGASTSDNASSTKSKGEVRRVTLNQTKVFNELEITIGEIAIESDKVTLGMTIKNNAKDPRTFYPNQHSIVIGKRQLDARMINNGQAVSGEINSGIERSDSLLFEDKETGINPADVKQIGLRLGPVYSMKNFKNVEVNWDLDVP